MQELNSDELTMVNGGRLTVVLPSSVLDLPVDQPRQYSD